MAQLIELVGPADTSEKTSRALDWKWAAKWSSILLGACVVVSAPFVLHAYVTKKPGTIWAER